MDGMPDFYIPSPEDRRLNDVLSAPARITLRRAGGEATDLQARPGIVSVTEEHPQVDRMGGDWGAICEVFRNNNYYYLTIPGIILAKGDEVCVYGKENAAAELKVIDIENGRARIDAPVIRVKGS